MFSSVCYPVFWIKAFWRRWGDTVLWFYFAFPWWIVLWNILSYIGDLYFSFGSCFDVLCWFLNSVGYFLSCWYFLDSFCWISGLQMLIFLLHVSWLYWSFPLQKFLNMIWCHLSNFAFVACALGVLSKNSSPVGMSWNLSLMFFSTIKKIYQVWTHAKQWYQYMIYLLSD